MEFQGGKGGKDEMREIANESMDAVIKRNILEGIAIVILMGLTVAIIFGVIYLAYNR